MTALDAARMDTLLRARVFTIPDHAVLHGAHRFDSPYQLVRLIERIFADRAAVGAPGASPQDEPIQFRHVLALEAPSADVVRITPPVRSIHPSRLIAYVSMLGVVPPGGTLPPYYTQLAMSQANLAHREREQEPPHNDLDPGLAKAIVEAPDFLPGPFGDLLDLLAHRLFSLNYRAWEHSRPMIGFERAWWRHELTESTTPLSPSDELSTAVAALLGMDFPGAAARLGVAEPAGTLPAVGALAMRRPRPARVVCDLLRREMGIPVKLIPLQGPVLPPATESRWQLGTLRTMLRSSGTSDDRAWFARKEWHPQDQITLELGPMPWESYRTFLPADDPVDATLGAGYRKLMRVARLLTGEHVAINVRPLLDGADVRPLQLGGDRGIRLGWSSWLMQTPHADRPPDPPTFLADPSMPPPLPQARVVP